MPSIMIAGTSSHVGKSVIVAAICKILSKIGYDVAPFKAQNMSLNSFVTKEGKEIAMAQAFQARACGVEPNEFMNPILLKPKGEGVSQLVILGEAVRDVTVREYYGMFKDLLKIVEDSYRRLEKEFDVVVIEGAGGIAEINLYEFDLANIWTARIARPSLIIVGDIDRGGVFASLYGTYSLLPKDIASMVKGFVINKFRGDISLLRGGLEEIERLTGVRVLGVIPFVNLTFTPEDSLGIDEWGCRDALVGILKLPRISNWTDFEHLRPISKFVWKGERLSDFEVVIIPGTKNTIADLMEMKSAGIHEEIRRIAGKIPVIGICGGYQMLCKEIVDMGVEHGNLRVKGIGLLDAITVFDEFKKRTAQVYKRVTGDAVIIDRIKGEVVWGYEIHKGKTYSKRPIFEDEGCMSEDGMAWGTYLHGLFENDNVLRALSEYLGIKIGKRNDWIDVFSKVVERSLDLDYLLARSNLK